MNTPTYDPADRNHFVVSPEVFDELAAMLDAPAKGVPALRDLLARPTVFDQKDDR